MKLPHPDPALATEEEWWWSMRAERNRLLNDSDWTQTLDAPVDREAWATYRQQLRDFPATWTPGETANFPEAPA